jgi:hypothetical protein
VQQQACLGPPRRPGAKIIRDVTNYSYFGTGWMQAEAGPTGITTSYAYNTLGGRGDAASHVLRPITRTATSRRSPTVRSTSRTQAAGTGTGTFTWQTQDNQGGWVSLGKWAFTRARRTSRSPWPKTVPARSWPGRWRSSGTTPATPTLPPHLRLHLRRGRQPGPGPKPLTAVSSSELSISRCGMDLRCPAVGHQPGGKCSPGLTSGAWAARRVGCGAPSE